MSVPVCSREREALDAVLHGGWPSSVDADLRAHVDACPVCADVVTVAAAMRDEHALACEEAQVPSAGLVWWRAELRARRDAARKAARPMTFVQVIAAACGLAAALTVGGLFSSWARSMFGDLAATSWGVRVPEIDASLLSSAISQGGGVLLLAVSAWLVLVPVALYVAFSRD